MPADAKVSVLCITYNQAAYISDALESFLAQRTSFPFEILVNDDASTDGTTQIVLDYARRHPDKIRVVTHETNQFAQVRDPTSTFLLPLAHGEFLALCEGDDYWCDPDKLQRQYDAMTSPEGSKSALCVHATKTVNASTKEEFSVIRLHEGDARITLADLVSRSQIPATNSFFIRREAYQSYLASDVYPLKAHGDHKMVLYFATLGPVTYLDETMSAYRMLAAGSINHRLLLASDRADRERELCAARTQLIDVVDEMTQGACHEAAVAGKREYEYIRDLTVMDYPRLRSTWGERFGAESAKTKVKTWVGYRFPNLYRWCMRRVLKAKYR